MRGPRGRLLAAGSNVLSIVDEIAGGTDLDSFAAVLFTRAGALGAYDGGVDEAAQKAGVACGLPPDASPEIREFRREAGTVCEAYDPPVAGVPSRIAGLVRQRADEHSRLALPADATDLERDTLAAERELARVAAAVPRRRVRSDGSGGSPVQSGGPGVDRLGRARHRGRGRPARRGPCRRRAEASRRAGSPTSGTLRRRRAQVDR